MKNIILITLLFSLNHALAQPLSKSVQAMVDAERQFARISKETNTVNAFISSLSPTALFMIQGEEVNGLESWKKREADESLLFWEPEFADIASSEDFGYTTGPFAYYSNRSDTVAAFRGYYSSIWGKELNGEWKVLF